MDFEECRVHRGSGDRNIVLVGFGGTILMQDVNGRRMPDQDVLMCQARDGISHMDEAYRQRLREVTVLSARPLIDSADATVQTIADSVAVIRKILKERKPHAVLMMLGTDTFTRFGAAMFQGLPRDEKAPVVMTCSMRPFTQDVASDSTLAIRNSLDLCSDDEMVDRTATQSRGKLAAVINGGSYAYPAGFLQKATSTFNAFISRANRMAKRSTTFDDRARQALLEDDEGGRTFREPAMWPGKDGWMFARRSRLSDFPQGDRANEFQLQAGIKHINLSPGFMYAALVEEVMIAKKEAVHPPDVRTLHALLCTAPGAGTLRTDPDSQDILKSVSEELFLCGIPMAVGSEAMAKQRPPANEPLAEDQAYLYPGDPRLVGQHIIDMTGLAPGETEILLARLLAEAHRLGKKGPEIASHVKSQVEAYISQWK